MNRDLVRPFLFESIASIDAIESIVLARFDRSGLLVHANAGYRRIAAGQNLSLWQLVTQPRMEAVLSATPGPDGSVYSGLITATCPNGELRSLKGSIVVEHEGIALVAGYDMDGAETLASALQALNDELNEAYRDLSRSKQALEAREAEILKLSLTDALTGVGNRRMLNEVLAREVARSARGGQPLSLVILDIDHFKRVNDNHGHEMGDFVLKETGATLLRLVRLSDIATRMGGEEFVVLLPATSVDEALVCAERMRAALAQHDFGLPTAVTSSFGVACLLAGESGAALLARADKALYIAKQQGRNRVVDAADPPLERPPPCTA